MKRKNLAKACFAVLALPLVLTGCATVGDVLDENGKSIYFEDITFFGGNGVKVGDYLYYAKEGHSYILEVWMSFGIIGILAYIFIISITLKNGTDLLKNTNKNNEKYKTFLSIIVGLSFIIVHSIMDFDMSYLIIEMVFYMFIAIINDNDRNLKLKKDIQEKMGKNQM